MDRNSTIARHVSPTTESFAGQVPGWYGEIPPADQPVPVADSSRRPVEVNSFPETKLTQEASRVSHTAVVSESGVESSHQSSQHSRSHDHVALPAKTQARALQIALSHRSIIAEGDAKAEATTPEVPAASAMEPELPATIRSSRRFLHGKLSRTAGLVSAMALTMTLLVAAVVAIVCPTTWPAGLAGSNQTLKAAGTPANSVVLDFTASWCGPCQQMSPIVSKLQRQGYAIRKVDVDQEPNLARQFRVDSMPTFILVIDGKEVNRIVGMTNEAQLRRMAEQAVQGSQLARGQQERLAVPGSKPLPKTNSSPFDADGVPTTVLGESSRLEAEIVSNPRNAPAAPRTGILNSISEGMGLTRSASPSIPAEPKSPAVPANELFRGNNAEDDAEMTVASVDPALASVRIRVRDSQGGMSNYGSGTIVDSQTGRTMIVTCGHIFRDLKSKPVVEVDVFQAQGSPRTYLGEVMDFNLDADVGLIMIPTEKAVSVARLSPVDVRLGPGEEMFSIGCGGGANPSRESHKVTAINRYNGPENIECTGVPIQGRSGGGLFRADGQLAGVCIAADTKERRGLYAGLEPICTMLEKHRLGALVRREGRGRANTAVASAVRTADAGSSSETTGDSLMAGGGNNRAVSSAASSNNGGTNAAAEAALMNQSPDAEIICIVRPRGGAGDNSRIVVLNRASQTFMTYLMGEVDSQSQRLPVSLRVDDNQRQTASSVSEKSASAGESGREPAREALGPRPWVSSNSTAFKRQVLPRREELVPLTERK